MEVTKIFINWMEPVLIRQNAKETEFYWEWELDECEKFTKEYKIACCELEKGYYQNRKNEYIKKKRRTSKKKQKINSNNLNWD
jgi:hypothetical protein